MLVTCCWLLTVPHSVISGLELPTTCCARASEYARSPNVKPGEKVDVQSTQNFVFFILPGKYSIILKTETFGNTKNDQELFSRVCAPFAKTLSLSFSPFVVPCEPEQESYM